MRVSWHVAGYGAMGLFLVGSLFAYEGARRDKDRSDAVQKAQVQVQKDLNAQVSDLQKRIADRDAIHQEQVAALKKQMGQAKSPAQIAHLAEKVMDLPEPIRIEAPAPTPSNPSPQPVAIVPTSDSQATKDYIQQCEACKIDLPKLQADLMDRNKQMALAQKQIESLTIQRDAAVKATNSGSWIRRAVHNGKVAAIGGAAALAIACGTGHCPK